MLTKWIIDGRKKPWPTSELFVGYDSHESVRRGQKLRPRLVHASIARGIIDDNSVRVTVVDAEKNKVEYNGETTSLSPLAEKLRNVSAIQGTSVFTYNGKKITDIAEETQWKKEDTLSETETDDLL